MIILRTLLRYEYVNKKSKSKSRKENLYKNAWRWIIQTAFILWSKLHSFFDQNCIHFLIKIAFILWSKLYSLFDQNCIHFLSKIAFTFWSKLHSLSDQNCIHFLIKTAFTFWSKLHSLFNSLISRHQICEIVKINNYKTNYHFDRKWNKIAKWFEEKNVIKMLIIANQ